MIYRKIFIFLVELFCVAILSLCGVVAFSNAGLYTEFELLVSRLLPSVSSYLLLLLFLLLFAPGFFFIAIRNKGGGILTIAVMLLCLPSFLSFNTVDLLKIFGGSTHIATRITLIQMLSIGSLVITIYFLLDLINQLKYNIRHLETLQAPDSDLKVVLQPQIIMSIILAGGALLISLIITALARGFEYLFSRNTFILSWWIVPVALFCIMILGIYLYWITTRKNS
jgi:hypothetical protein